MTTLFYKCLDLSEGFANWKRTFRSNVFDIYSHSDKNIKVYHRQDNDLDVFSVETMIYEYKGCWVGNSVHFGKFDNFADAVAHAESVQLPEGSVGEEEVAHLR